MRQFEFQHLAVSVLLTVIVLFVVEKANGDSCSQKDCKQINSWMDNGAQRCAAFINNAVESCNWCGKGGYRCYEPDPKKTCVNQSQNSMADAFTPWTQCDPMCDATINPKMQAIPGSTFMNNQFPIMIFLCQAGG